MNIILLLVILFTVILIKCKNSKNSNEHMADISPITNEALQNIASLYNTAKMNVTDFTSSTITTDKINANDTILNGIKFSKNYSSYPDGKADGAELSNDLGTFKKLMILGNRSSGGDRNIGMWDNVDIEKNLNVKQAATINNATIGNNLTTQQMWTKGGTSGGGGQTHFPFTDGKNYIRGDTQVDGAVTLNKPISFRVMPNTQAIYGFDIDGAKDFKTTSLDDCVNQCKAKGAVCANRRKSDGQCWCKRALAIESVIGGDTNWDAAFFV